MRRHTLAAGLLLLLSCDGAGTPATLDGSPGAEAAAADLSSAEGVAPDLGQLSDQRITESRPAEARPPCAPVTTPCPQSEMRCYGDPDKGIVCGCPDSWSCSSTGSCSATAPLPSYDAITGWSCTWTASAFSCTWPKTTPPVVGAGWTCKPSSIGVVCTRSFPPNPCKTAAGAKEWSCTFLGSAFPPTLSCTRK